jgi:hypothetical protein
MLTRKNDIKVFYKSRPSKTNNIMTIRKFSRYLILVIHVLLAKKNITALYIENKQKKNNNNGKNKI